MTQYKLAMCMCKRLLKNSHLTLRLFRTQRIHFYKSLATGLQGAALEGFHSITGTQFFVPLENNFFHELLEKRTGKEQPLFPHPSSIVLNESKRIQFMKEYIFFSDSPSGKVCADFHKHALEHSIGLPAEKRDKMDSMTYEFVKNIPVVLKKVTDSEIEGVFFSICLFSSHSTPMPYVFKNLCKSLDHECCARVSAWKTDRQIRVADYFHHLHLSRLVRYNTKFINQLFEKFFHLSTREIIQMLFFVNVNRKVSPCIMADIEKKLFLSINDFTVEELSVACLAFFKTKTEMNFRPLVHQLYDIVIRNISSLSSMNNLILTTFLKQLTYSSRYEHCKAIEALLEASLPFVHKWENAVLMRLCLMGSDLGVYNPKILNRAIENVNANVESFRLKEIANIFFSSCHYGYRPSNMNLLVRTVLEALRNREQHVDKHPQTLINSLEALSYLNQYPNDILEKLFRKMNSEYPTANKWQKYWENVATFDCCIEIECPSYEGPRLDPTHRSKALKLISGPIPSWNCEYLTFQERLLLTMFDALKSELNPHECRLVHILPHYFRPDIVFCCDKNGCYTDFPEIWCLEKNDILYPEEGHTYTVVVAIGLKKSERNCTELTGNLSRKIRQLQALGYRVIPLPVSEFITLNQPERVLLMKNKIRT